MKNAFPEVISICELPSGDSVATIPVPDATAFVFAPAGDRVVVDRKTETAVWSGDGNKLYALDTKDTPRLSFSLDGKRLFGGFLDNYALSEGDGRIRVWDATTGTELGEHVTLVDPTVVTGVTDTAKGPLGFGGELILWPSLP